jgi:hypothetical protein
MKMMLTHKAGLTATTVRVLVLSLLAIAGCGSTGANHSAGPDLAVPLDVNNMVGWTMGDAVSALHNGEEGIGNKATFDVEGPASCPRGQFDYVVWQTPNGSAPPLTLRGACSVNGPTSTTPTTTIPTTPVPNVVGMTVFNAENALNSAGFEVAGGANETCNGGATDYVTSQSPKAGTSAADDSDVTITGSCPASG